MKCRRWLNIIALIWIKKLVCRDIRMVRHKVVARQGRCASGSMCSMPESCTPCIELLRLKQLCHNMLHGTRIQPNSSRPNSSRFTPKLGISPTEAWSSDVQINAVLVAINNTYMEWDMKYFVKSGDVALDFGHTQTLCMLVHFLKWQTSEGVSSGSSYNFVVAKLLRWTLDYVFFYVVMGFWP